MKHLIGTPFRGKTTLKVQKTPKIRQFSVRLSGTKTYRIPKPIAEKQSLALE